MVSVADFRKPLAEYLAGLVDRKAFTKSFMDLFYGIRRNGEPPAIELGYAIESVLTRAVLGLISEDKMRESLASIAEGGKREAAAVNQVFLTELKGQPLVRSNNSIMLMAGSPFRASFATSDTSRAMGFGSRVAPAL
jgi:hypothetical protein